ncbi:MAG: alpha/beta fold hydrolase [Bryobacterales bacterium]|nr:alpha/beta fold hydrolase [Bryobacterales bacterium]
MRPFHPLVRNPHWQTIAGSFWRRPFRADLYPVRALYHQTEPGVRVLVHEQSPHGDPQGILLLVHGLEGSSDGGYMRSLSHAALRAGFIVHRANTRSCGGTEALCNTLYHAGLTTDVEFLARHLCERHRMPVHLCGFSLGGNMVLKLAGELGDRAPGLLASVTAVSTPIDLKACATAIDKPGNWLYQRRFLRSMSARLHRRQKLMPGVFRFDDPEKLRTIYDFDDQITAQFFGFGSAERYYGTQSAGLFLDAIRVPTLLIQAKDDPMIPFEVFQHPAFQRNPLLKLHAVDHGGHVGFVARGRDRFWVDHAVTDWITDAGNKHASHSVSS